MVLNEVKPSLMHGFELSTVKEKSKLSCIIFFWGHLCEVHSGIKGGMKILGSGLKRYSFPYTCQEGTQTEWWYNSIHSEPWY